MRIVLTPGGRRRATARLARVRAEFNAIVADMPAALESGDTSGWHDNFAFEDNQRQMQHLAARVRDLERALDQAEDTKLWDRPPPRICIGASFGYRFEDEPDDVAHHVWLAGYGDGAPEQGRLSYDSPIGRAVLGAEEGDTRRLQIDGRTRTIEILEIGPTPEGADDADLPAPHLTHAQASA